jgi:hypothetical protein
MLRREEFTAVAAQLLGPYAWLLIRVDRLRK